MDQNSFGFLTRALVSKPSRREVLRGLVGVGLGPGVLHAPLIADARKKRKRQKARPKVAPNSYGCLEVDDPCETADECCSGVCEGKKGKQRCQAHDIGTCNQVFPGLCSNPPTIASCNDSSTCYCLRTTANSNFCAQLGKTHCTACSKDSDCIAEGMPAGSACISTSGIICQTECPQTGMVCMPPCGVEIPEPLPTS